MPDLIYVKRLMIIVVHLAGASVCRRANLADVSRTIVSKFPTAYTNPGKVSSVNHNIGLNLKLNDCERRVLMKIVPRKQKSKLPQISLEMNAHLLIHIYLKPIQRQLHDANIQGRLATAKPLVLAWNAMKRLK
ncbi:transposable element Tc1 transposase [Trichonephila clavipes]|nr:transposable element Tc1 transposase [Trichonephila clavipes]